MVFSARSPQPITNLGLPSKINKVSAAFVWGKNDRAYIFAGEEYYKMNQAMLGVSIVIKYSLVLLAKLLHFRLNQDTPKTLLKDGMGYLTE